MVATILVVQTLEKRMNTRWLISLALVGALIVGGLFRFISLGVIPAGLTWDEAAIGYNGYAIGLDHRDEWLQLMPVSFRSFGDYKAPLAIYVTGISTLLFGISPLSIRLPFAVAGIASVLGMALLIYEWSLARGQSVRSAQLWGVFAAWVTATTPWHVHFSRIAFESGLALCFVIWTMVGYFRWRRTAENTWMYLFWGAWTAAGFVASFYTYHSAKVFGPLLILGLLWWSRSKIFQYWRSSVALIFVTSALLAPLAYDSWAGKGTARLTQTSIFSQESTVSPVVQIAQNFVSHLDLRFLVGGATTTFRHGDGRWGVFLPLLIVPLLIGVWAGVRRRSGATWLAYWWVVCGIVPACIGFEVPHANRAFLAFPGFVMIMVLGTQWILQWVKSLQMDQLAWGTHGERYMISRSVIGTAVLLYSISALAYGHHYFTTFAAQSGDDFLAGYWEVFEIIHQHPEISRVRMTNTYGQPYIYALASGEMSPIVYQQGGLANYDFVDKITPSDAFRADTIVVGTPAELDPPAGARLVRGPDGTVRFIVIVNK
jgi:hypothetical protein